MPDHEVEIPSAFPFAWDTVQVLRDLGGSGSIEEINESVVKLRGLTEEQQAVPHPRGNRSEIEYRLAWARTLVKDLGLITNSQRGVWALTPAGQTVTKEGVDELKKERSRRRAAARKKAKQAAEDAGLGTEDVTEVVEPEDDDEIEETDWKAELLDVLKEMDPYAFERLAKRLLREAGFANVTVTGGAGDHGIDGTGVYRFSPLLSFPVYFQCKRYAGTVGSGKVRDFRGAMIGRGDKGLLITTGTFTPDAKAEATRDGAPPLDLIDGDELVELLREHGVGVTRRRGPSTTSRSIGPSSRVCETDSPPPKVIPFTSPRSASRRNPELTCRYRVSVCRRGGIRAPGRSGLGLLGPRSGRGSLAVANHASVADLLA